MGKLDEAVNVAYGVNARHVGLHVFIDNNASCCRFNAHVCKVQALQVGCTTYSHQHEVSFNALYLSFLLEVHHEGRIFVDFLCCSACVELNATLLETCAQAFCQIAVELWQDFLAELNDSHL